MDFHGFLLVLLMFEAAATQKYEESIGDLLVQCNAYQKQINFKNRTAHSCEKEHPDGDFRYFITPMKAEYSKRDFLCALFFKNRYSTLNFQFLFTHPNFTIDAYGIKFNKPQGSLFESEVVSKVSVLVLLSNRGSPALDVLEWKMNGEEMCPACGDKPRVVGLISDGSETSAAQWPWHVSLWRRGSSDMNYICGGSVLNKKWVISAAHCMFSGGQPINENLLIIRIGSEKKLSAAYKQFKVQNLIIHENYNTETFENDVAMVKLNEILTFSGSFKAICYSQLGEIPEASVGTAVGYGSTDKNRDHSDILRQIEIPIIDKEECLDSDMEFYRKYLFPGNFCAGEIGVLKGVCSGDSGGGFYVRVRNHWFLQGITSNTKISTSLLNPTCNYASYALFTNVTYYTDWINQKIISN